MDGVTGEFLQKWYRVMTGKTVAIVGSGPAGLSAAFYLALLGHKVTVYEKAADAGGMLRYALPEYRLPKKIVKASRR